MPIGKGALRRAAALTLLTVVALGCSKGPPGPPPKFAVRGKVVRQGKPVPLVLVTFVPDGNTTGERFDGGTGLDGAFQLQCPQGRYKVTLNPVPIQHGAADPGGGGLGGAPDPKDAAKSGDVAPLRYRKPETTPLPVVDVPEGGKSDLVLEVK